MQDGSGTAAGQNDTQLKKIFRESRFRAQLGDNLVDQHEENSSVV